MSQSDPKLPPDLLEVVHALDAQAPRMTETEFARVRRTALGRVTAGRPRSAGPLTRSRVAITSMLAVGAVMSTGGAALGVSALSTDLSSRAAQYGTATSQSPGQTLAPPSSAPATGNADQGGSGDAVTPAGGSGDATTGKSTPSAPQAGETNEVATAATQGPRQLEGGGRSELPFTGYAAIPLLLVGLALLAAGCVLRRGNRRVSAPR